MTTATIPHRNYQKDIRSYTIFTVLFLLVAAGYSYFQYIKLTETKQALLTEQDVVNQISTASKQMNAQYTGLAGAFDKDFNSLKDGVQAVFPDKENYTELTRSLDAFVETNNNSMLSPIFMSDLKFGEPRIDAVKEYSVLPFNLTLSTTNDNFTKFLRFIENSGSITAGDRLMEVTSISINFPTDQGSANSSPSDGTDGVAKGVDVLNVTLGLNAYFQKAATTTTGTQAGSAAASTTVAASGN